MTSEPTPTQNNPDNDVVTKRDVAAMLEDRTYDKAQIDAKFKTHDSIVNNRLQDKADIAQMEKLQGIVLRLEGQITTFGDTTRALPIELKAAYEAESKRRSEMHDLQLANVNTQIASLIQAIDRLVSKTERQDQQHDELVTRVSTVEINEAETRNANALAWSRVEQALYGDKKDDKDKGLIGKVAAIDSRLIWVDNRRSIERWFAKTITSKPFLYIVGAMLGGGGALALLAEIIS